MADALRVHVVPLDLGREPDGWLSPSERARADRFAFAADRRRFAATRIALRGVLAAARGEAPEAVAIAVDARGKPFVEGGPSFNVSHAGAWALIATAGAAPVGVDLEVVRPMPDLEAMARSTLAAAELAAWEAAPDRLAAFYRAWTRKEAVLKAAGVGLGAPLTGVDVSTDVVACEGARWAVRGWDVAPGVAAAIALPFANC